MIYTIRSNTAFTIVKQGIVYSAGQQVDLTEAEFQRHKQKLEGSERSVVPIVFPQSNIKSDRFTYDDSTANIVDGTASADVETAIVNLDSRLDAIDSGNFLVNGADVSLLNNNANYQTLVQVDSKINALINGAPGTLDTLGEIAAALAAEDNAIAALTTVNNTQNTNISALQSLSHPSVTLGTNPNGLSLNNQAISLALATGSSAGAMTAGDKTKLNAIVATGSGAIITNSERIDFSAKVNSSNSSITNIIKLTQAQYNALTPSSSTLYVIDN